MKRLKLILTIFCIIQAPYIAAVNKVSDVRLDEVAAKGRTVMPFSLEKTLHIFSKIEKGGIQQVIAKELTDHAQISLIQQHLAKIHQDFKQGDFSDPKKIHGQQMPGLATIQAATSGDIILKYRKLKNGAEITYTAEKPVFIDAIHLWFDAQLSDHARHATIHRFHHKMHRGKSDN